MDLCRSLLSQAVALLEDFSYWTPEECEALAKRILSSARKICHDDEDVVRANLIEALILSCEQELRDEECALLKNLLTRVKTPS